MNACGDCEAPGSYGWDTTISGSVDPTQVHNTTLLCDPKLVLQSTAIWANVSFAAFQTSSISPQEVSLEIRTLNYFPLEVTVLTQGDPNKDPVITAPSTFVVPCCNEPHTLSLALDMSRTFTRSGTDPYSTQTWELKDVLLSARRLPGSGGSGGVGNSIQRTIRVFPVVTDCSAVPDDSPNLCGALPMCFFCQLGYSAVQKTTLVPARETMAYQYGAEFGVVTSVAHSNSLVGPGDPVNGGPFSSDKSSHSNKAPSHNRQLFFSVLPENQGRDNAPGDLLADGSDMQQLAHGKCTTGRTAQVCQTLTARDLLQRQSQGDPAYRQGMQAALSTNAFSRAVLGAPAVQRGLVMAATLLLLGVGIAVYTYVAPRSLDHENVARYQ